MGQTRFLRASRVDCSWNLIKGDCDHVRRVKKHINKYFKKESIISKDCMNVQRQHSCMTLHNMRSTTYQYLNDLSDRVHGLDLDISPMPNFKCP